MAAAAASLPVKIGIIGGTGLDDPDILEGRTEKYVDTPYGKPSDALILGKIKNVDCVLLARHGRHHTIMPSNVNYRANIWALKEENCSHVLVTTACGSLREEIQPGDLVIIDQFIDRSNNQSFGRPGTSEKYEALVDTGSQCTLMASGSQELTLLEAEVSLTGREWQKHPMVTDPKAPYILGIGIAAAKAEDIKQLNTLLSENPSTVGLLKVEEQQVPIATSTVHHWQYRTNQDAVIPIHKMIRELESQGVVSKTHSPFNSPIWPVRKSDGEWRLTVDYHTLNEVTPLLSAAVPDMLELQYELESKAARGGNSPTICHGLIQAALEDGEASDHLQYLNGIIVWGKTAVEVFEKGEIIQILLEAGFAIKKSKVKGPAQEIHFLRVTRKENDFHWGAEQQKAFTQIKQEVTPAVALGPVTTGPEVILDCEKCAAIKQAKWVKPLWYDGRWSKYKYREAWQIDCITLPQTHQSKRYVLTMVEATTGWLETYPVPHSTVRNTILGLEKQVLIDTAKKLGLQCHSKGTMITIEGPRFSSRAESCMFRSWGADVINMTTVPEVILAREAGMSYASVAMATDYDCWKEHEEAVSVDKVLKTLKENANKATSILLSAIPQIGSMEWTDTLHTLKIGLNVSVLRKGVNLKALEELETGSGD
ncbi:hypothetical protein TURU_009164 [Turdus rufiventris]|nr:hypothetical protein TURU_009164 [Turdus rufiventris]